MDIRDAGPITQQAYLHFKARHHDKDSLVNLKAFRILSAELVILRDLSFALAIDNNDSYFLQFAAYERSSDGAKEPYFAWFERHYVPYQTTNSLSIDVLKKICQENPFTYDCVSGALKTAWELQSLRKPVGYPSVQDYPEPTVISFSCAWNHGIDMGEVECAFPNDGDTVTLRYQSFPTSAATKKLKRQHIGVALMRNDLCVGWLSFKTRYQVPWQWWERHLETRWEVYGISYHKGRGNKGGETSTREGYLRRAPQ